MLKLDNQKLLTRFLILGALVACLGILLNKNGYVSLATSNVSKPMLQPAASPVVSAQPESNTPLQISSVSVTLKNPLEPEANFVVTNVSNKPISAYAIRHTVTFGSASSEGATVRNSNSIAAVLQPTHSEPGVFEGEAFSTPVQSINLAVDFVEFTDGKTWGADKFKSAEKLAGQRAGAAALVKHLAKLLETDPGATATAIAENNIEVSSPSGNSEAWLDGFREGVNFQLGRLRYANEQGGVSGIASELQQPFDASKRGRN